MTGCASKARNIPATYTSPLQYQGYNCQQIGSAFGRFERKISEVHEKKDSTATKDAVAMSVGLVVFWPALFFLPGVEHKEEVGRLKGEFDALESIAIEKDCKLVLAEIYS